MEKVKFEPLVSVVITARNRRHILKRALDSVVAQTYRNIEIVYEDAASTDGTMDFIKDYVKENNLDNRFVCNSQKDNSVSEGRNIGLSLTHGEYVVFFDSDDIMLPQRIEKQVESLENGRYTASCAGFSCTNGDYVFIPPYDEAPAIEKFLRRNNHIALGTQCWMLNREVLLKINGYREDFKSIEDADLIFRYMLVSQNFGFVHEALTIWDNTDDENRLTTIDKLNHSQFYVKNKMSYLRERIEYIMGLNNVRLLFININFLVSFEKEFNIHTEKDYLEFIKLNIDEMFEKNNFCKILYKTLKLIRGFQKGVQTQ